MHALSFEKRTFKTLMVLFSVLFLVYMYVVGTIVFNIVARKDIEHSNQLLTSSLNEMELTYLDSSNSINKSLAQTLGFKEATDATYVSRSTNVSLLVLGNNDL